LKRKKSISNHRLYKLHEQKLHKRQGLEALEAGTLGFLSLPIYPDLSKGEPK
jgi:hypothetical protein